MLTAEQAIARASYLNDLAGREADAWRQVDALIETRRPIDYDQAVRLLKDLLDRGARIGRGAEFESRLRQLRERHSKKSSLPQRLAKAGWGTTFYEGSSQTD